MTGEDLDAAITSAASSDEECAVCAFPWWSCLCSASGRYRAPTPEEIEDAREQRLTRHELTEGGAHVDRW